MTNPDLSHIEWRKSSRSSGNGQCVEVGVWRKISLSGNGPSCVEVALAGNVPAEAVPAADLGRLFLVRDSKDSGGPVLAFTSSEWDAFLTGVKSGDFEDLA
ncbi:DUF397 domain-containing protein [Streptosporangium sp. NPDC006007]|uniref:DUF397 domain-containing protein n=1 Tax=Streptosporangium sp. NPDC006007 TaxID=3154575 RepID=UPI0033A96BCA